MSLFIFSVKKFKLKIMSRCFCIFKFRPALISNARGFPDAIIPNAQIGKLEQIAYFLVPVWFWPCCLKSHPFLHAMGSQLHDMLRKPVVNFGQERVVKGGCHRKEKRIGAALSCVVFSLGRQRRARSPQRPGLPIRLKRRARRVGLLWYQNHPSVIQRSRYSRYPSP
jgi:hypothetical protein